MHYVLCGGFAGDKGFTGPTNDHLAASQGSHPAGCPHGIREPNLRDRVSDQQASLSSIVHLVERAKRIGAGSRPKVDVMKARFYPCYLDAFFPEVVIATSVARAPEREVVFLWIIPVRAPCNRGARRSGATEALFVRISGFDYIVTPSGSCTHHVRDHLTASPNPTELEVGSGRTSWSNSCCTS